MQGVLGADRVRIELYVDDTFLAFFNTEHGCREDFSIVVYIWAALGLPLALKKADFATNVAWTSGGVQRRQVEDFGWKMQCESGSPSQRGYGARGDGIHCAVPQHQRRRRERATFLHGEMDGHCECNIHLGSVLEAAVGGTSTFRITQLERAAQLRLDSADTRHFGPGLRVLAI